VSSYFNPDELKSIEAAYEEAKRALRFALLSGVTENVRRTEDRLAKIVMSLAQRGDVEPRALSDAALGEMPPLQANWSQAEKL